MDLVDVEDLELTTGRCEADRFAQIADLLDAIVRGTVDFKHVKRAAFGDFHADRFVRVEIRFRAAGAVERFGENAGGGCLAGAAWTDEQVGVCQPLLQDGVAQRADDMVLTEDVVEGFGAVFAGEDLVTHGGDHRDVGSFVMAGFSRDGKLSESSVKSLAERD